MRKILAVLLSLSMLFALAACTKVEETEKENPKTSVSVKVEKEENAETKDETPAPEQDEDAVEEKPKDESVQEPAEKPESKPEEKPESKPTEKPSTGNQTAGNVLLADFKAKAGSAKDMLSLAEALIGNEIIPFAGGAVEIEPGLLAGFGNTEIKGFKSGACFMPMIGSLAFVGYVFELESGTDVNAFISTLKSNADMRWNVCTEAEEMVVGNVGNKVFFIMCPKNLDA